MKESPFIPELGKIPPVVIERPIFREFLKMLTSADEKPKNCILVGERGSGKTVTLKILRELALTQKTFPILINCDEEKANIDKLSYAIYRKTYESMTEQVLSFRALEFIKKLKLKVAVGYDDFGVKVELGKPAAHVDQYNLTKELKKIVKDKKIAFLFDETQSIFSTGVARFLINLFYSELPDVLPYFVTVLCGTQRLERDILEATPAYRAFPTHKLLAFNEKETQELLQMSTYNTPVKFSDDACNEIWKDTKGLPYYVHYCGDWLYREKERNTINKDFYSRHKQKMLKRLGEEILERRLKSLEEKGRYRDIYTALAQSTPSIEDIELKTINVKDIPTVSQLTESPLLKDMSSGSASVYISRLWRDGYLTQVDRGRYIPSDPLLAKRAKKEL